MTPGIESVVRVADDRFAVAVESAAEGQNLLGTLRSLPGLLEAVGGMRSVELLFDLAATTGEAFQRDLAALLSDLPNEEIASGALHEIRVHYGGADGPDLDDVCRELGLTRDAFIERHTAVEWSVAMLGFTPGFAYLDGDADDLAVPRLTTPRAAVPAGSVGLAGGRTGIYSLPGPGGWQLVGRTDEELFRRAESDPFRLHASDRVRFVAANDTDEAS